MTMLLTKGGLYPNFFLIFLKILGEIVNLIINKLKNKKNIFFFFK